MEYRINSYIDVQALDNGRVLVLNKHNGQSYELGKREAAIISLMDGKRTPNEISVLCEFFTEEEIISLEDQLFNLDIIGKKKQHARINLLKIKIPLFSPNKIFKNIIVTNIFYYIFIVINMTFVTSGIICTLLNIVYGMSAEKNNYIQSFSTFQQFEFFDIGYIIVFFAVSLFLHEFGHMIVALKHKINVPDVGIMLYLFIPCAYTNLTFLNYCNDKRVKLKIFVAGTLSDAGLLGIAMSLFYFYAPLAISKYFLISALVCMVAMIGNLVVTFKFDGYYILQTILDINNLKKTTLNIVIAYIGGVFAKIRNRDKKLDLRQYGQTDMNLEFIFSVVYIVLSIIYVPVMIASGIIMTFVQLGGELI